LNCFEKAISSIPEQSQFYWKARSVQ